MLSLINSLLDLSQMETHSLPLQLEFVQVSYLIEPATAQLAFLLQRSQITLAVNLESDANLVLADPQVTIRILVNLLGNAIHFSPNDSTVTIQVSPAAGELVCFRISDQGPGIPREWRDRIFDKFTQVQARKAGAAVGNGLGLTFCKLAVEAQGGRIWLESEPDQQRGTTVVFTLPSPPASTAEAQQRSRPAPGSPEA